MLTHKEIQNYLFKHKEVLASALGLPSLWIRKTEYVVNKTTNESVDLLFQNQYSAREICPNTYCYALEIKKDKGDHEVLGQLKKYIDVLEREGKSTGHWHKVFGVAAAHRFTESGAKLLWQAGFKTFLIRENKEGLRLEQIKPKRRAVC